MVCLGHKGVKPDQILGFAFLSLSAGRPTAAYEIIVEAREGHRTAKCVACQSILFLEPLNELAPLSTLFERSAL